jgi:prevent-host-death family protein
MATTVTVHEAKTHLSRLIAQALNGEDVVIARGAEPKVRLVPVDGAVRTAPRVPGKYKGQIIEHPGVWDPLTDEELREMGL